MSWTRKPDSTGHFAALFVFTRKIYVSWGHTTYSFTAHWYKVERSSEDVRAPLGRQLTISNYSRKESIPSPLFLTLPGFVFAFPALVSWSIYVLLFHFVNLPARVNCCSYFIGNLQKYPENRIWDFTIEGGLSLLMSFFINLFIVAVKSFFFCFYEMIPNLHEKIQFAQHKLQRKSFLFAKGFFDFTGYNSTITFFIPKIYSASVPKKELRDVYFRGSTWPRDKFRNLQQIRIASATVWQTATSVTRTQSTPKVPQDTVR